MFTRLTRIFFRSRSPLAALRRAERAALRAKASSAAGGEGLDASGVADERDHDGDAAGEEEALHDMHAVRPQIQVAGDRPAAGKGGAEDLGADQDRRAEHGQHVLPRDPAIAGGVLFAAHGITPVGGRNLCESMDRSKLAQAASRRAFEASRPASASAARMRSISASASLTSGGRTTARGSRPSSTSASFMRLCMSAQGSA